MTYDKRPSQMVGRAVRSGKLVRQPCEVCGDPLVDGHHDDYSKPLNVRWLCREHHFETHGWTWWTAEKVAANMARDVRATPPQIAAFIESRKVKVPA